MAQSLHVLVVGPDAALAPELEGACAGVRGARVVVHAARDARLAVEAARSRAPDLVVFEPADLRALKVLAHELGHAAPDAALAVAYRPEALPEGAAEGQVFVEGLRAGVRDFLRRPLSSGELQQLVDRLERRPVGGAAALAPVIAFASNKGGVGKSTLSVNAAAALAQEHPDEVLLIDCSLQLGTCASMLDLTPETTIADAVREYERLDETLLRQLAVPHASGLRVLAAPNDPAEAYEVEAEAVARIINIARRAFRYVVVDTFPLLDNVIMAVLDLADRVYVVTNATVPTVVGTARLLATLERLGVPAAAVRIVLNLSHPDFAGALTAGDVAERLGRGVDHVVPWQKRCLTAVNTGQPYALEATRLFGFGRAFAGLVRDVGDVRPSRGAHGPAAPAPALEHARGGAPDDARFEDDARAAAAARGTCDDPEHRGRTSLSSRLRRAGGEG